MNENISQITKTLLNKHHIHLKKSLGQNLLIDQASLERITSAAQLTKDDVVIEIGTGTGILTKELAKTAKKVITFEIDKKIIEVAKDYLIDCDNVEIKNEDFIKVDMGSVIPAKAGISSIYPGMPAFAGMTAQTSSQTIKVVANVPYYVTTPIIEKILESKRFSSAVLTVQREFAERMAAKLGTKDYGSFTIFMNFYTEPEIISYIPRSSFLPQPDVGSAIISLKIRKTPPVDVKNEEAFFKAVRAAFGQRRKTLRNALSSVFDIKEIDSALKKAGIDPKRRGETLSIREFASIQLNKTK